MSCSLSICRYNEYISTNVCVCLSVCDVISQVYRSTTAKGTSGSKSATHQENVVNAST